MTPLERTDISLYPHVCMDTSLYPHECMGTSQYPPRMHARTRAHVRRWGWSMCRTSTRPNRPENTRWICEQARLPSSPTLSFSLSADIRAFHVHTRKRARARRRTHARTTRAHAGRTLSRAWWSATSSRWSSRPAANWCCPHHPYTVLRGAHAFAYGILKSRIHSHAVTRACR